MRRPSRKLRRVKLETTTLAPALAELVPVSEGVELLECHGWADTRGCLRRARANYSDGLQVDLFMTWATGKAKISSYKMTWRGQIAGMAS